MAISQPTTFERVFSRRDFFRGPACRAMLWSFCAALMLGFLLFHLFLMVDLLTHRGELVLPASERESLERLTGAVLFSEGPEDEQNRGRALAEAGGDLIFQNRGILPAVWWARETIWGPPTAAAYRRIPWLQQNLSAWTLLIVIGLGLGVARSLLLWRTRSLSAQVAEDSVTRMRRTIHRQALRLGLSDLQETAHEHVLRLFTTDMERVREGVFRWVYILCRDPLRLLILAGFVFSIHWRVALQCLIPLAACWYLLQRGQQRYEQTRRLEAARADSELKLLAESLRKARLVRGFGMENFEHEQFQKHLNRYRENVAIVRHGESWAHWGGWMLVVCCLGVIVFLVGSRVLVAPNDLPLSAAIAVLTAFGWMRRPLEGLWQLPAERVDASEAAERIHRYMNQIPEVSQAVGAKFLQPLNRSLQLDSVHYALPNKRKLLDGLDLKIPAGETVALVSLDSLESRALAYLLPRFIEPQLGRVLFDGEDIAWATLESLRAESIYVGGDDPFFTGTVRDNISCGLSEYSLQQVTDAAKQAHAHSFILKLSQGYETILGEHGEQLNAGESFRLGLARAILRDPALLVIEEPGTPLDDNTKSLLDDTYNRITAKRTVLFLPSRLSTVRRADRVVVLHRGKVEAIGTYSQLVKSSALYRHWEYMRFNEFRHELEPVG